MNYLMWGLFGLLAVLQILDIATTYRFLTKGTGVETYRIAKWAIGKFGIIPGLCIIKIPPMAGFGLALYFLGSYQLYGIIVTVVLCVFYVRLVYINWKL